MERQFIGQFKILRNAFIYKSGVLAAKRRLFPRKHPLILGYHTIETPAFLKRVLGISSDKEYFLKQIKYIADHYNVISINELISGLKNESVIPGNSVVITFDDGYRDVHDIALPILKKFKLPATVFVTAGSIETKGSSRDDFKPWTELW